MPRRRRRPPAPQKPPLDVETILAWCDAYHASHGRWPNRQSGPVAGADATWSGVEAALARGHRGLPGGSSLALLLEERRDYRHRNHLPELKVHDILRWAAAHKARTGNWPTADDGPVPEAPGETWTAIDLALNRGTRGLVRQKGGSLARLLARRRNRPHGTDKPDLTDDQVLRWAEAWRVLYGTWPTRSAGAVGSTGETWLGIDKALRNGGRGLAGGRSLFRLLKDSGRVEGDYTPYRLRKPRARKAAGAG